MFDGRLASQVDLVVVDAPGMFDRAGVYGERGEDYPDAALRFAVFSRAAAELVRQRVASGRPVDVVHCNDWATALVPTYLRALVAETPALAATRTVLTLHNVAHQGIFPRATLPTLGLGWEHFTVQGMEFYGGINFLKQGIVTADAVTTVSPTYAREIQTAEYGAKLEGVLAARGDRLVGICNGVDYSVWNPATDPALAGRYDAEDTSNKVRCKGALQKELGLPVDATAPLVASVGRMVAQKGTDLVSAALPSSCGRPTRSSSWPARARPRSSTAVETVSRSRTARGVRAGGQRDARAPHLRGRRPRARAESLRAVRPGPDVRPALWRAAGRARHGRAEGHRRRLRRPARDRDGLSLRCPERRGPRGRRPSARSPREGLAALAGPGPAAMRLDRGWEARRAGTSRSTARSPRGSAQATRFRVASTPRSARASHDTRSATRAATTSWWSDSTTSRVSPRRDRRGAR